jgi:hypothetical protein
VGGVRTAGVPFEECNVTVAEFNNVFHRKKGALFIIYTYAGHSLYFTMSGDRDRRHGERARDGGVHQNQAFDRAIDQHERIFFDQVGAAAMARHKVKVTLFQ